MGQIDGTEPLMLPYPTKLTNHSGLSIELCISHKHGYYLYPITKATSYRRQLLPLVFCLVIPLYLFFPQFGLTDGENISSFI